MVYRLLLAAGVASVLFATSASAIPIAPGSSIQITGSDSATTAVSIDLASGLVFSSVRTSAAPGSITGTFAGLIAPDLAGTIKNIPEFSPYQPIAGFYSFTSGGNRLTFDLNAVTVSERRASVGGSMPMLTLQGTGMFSLTGYEATAASFTLTTEGSDVTTFAATTGVFRVPEPASIALLGLALVGVGVLRRRASV